jgi:class 3 adenylate cyclase
VAGAIKLFNHDPQRCKGCETTKGFSDHMPNIVQAMADLSNYWLANYPLRCEVAAVYVDIVDATSFLIASGYQEGARVLQRFTERVDVALKKVVEQIETRARKDPNSYLAKMGGTPFFEKFTGDGMLLVFPYDRAALRAHPGTRTDDELGEQSIWEHIHQVLLSINDRWLEVLEEPQPKRVLREAALYTQPPRIAISSGPAYLGRFGPQLSVIGRPIIEAARLIELRDEYLAWEQAHYSARVPRSGNFLASGQFVHDFGLDKEGAEPLNKYQLRGLPGRRIVWKVPILRDRPRRQFI